jgi:sRNA-binding protein
LAAELHERLAREYPNVFALPNHAPLCPLAIGIHQQIIERFPDVSKRIIRKCLRAYTANAGYLRLLQANSPRFTLDGKASGFVSEAEAASATARLALPVGGAR